MSAAAHFGVPSIVAWEISELLRKTSRVQLRAAFSELTDENFYFKSMTITELRPLHLAIGHSLNFNRDPFDRLIVATALRLNLPLMTAENEISESRVCEIFWK
jgi:PIN domain nuclease of toxin-antitoxin system